MSDVTLTAAQYLLMKNLVSKKYPANQKLYRAGVWGALVKKGYLHASAGVIAPTEFGIKKLDEVTKHFKEILKHIKAHPECNLEYGGVLVPGETSTIKILRDLGYFTGKNVIRPSEKFNKVVFSNYFNERKYL